MKKPNRIYPLTCNFDRNFDRKFAGALLSALVLAVSPATAVKVNNLTEGFDDESTAIEQKAQISARYEIGRFHTGLEVRVLAAVDEKPVENVMVYFKPVEGEEVTTVHNTDHDGIARIEKITERKRTLFINDGKGLRLFQRLLLEPGKLSKMTFVLPYNSLITARPPCQSKLLYTVSALRLGKDSDNPRYNEGSYHGEVRQDMLSARVPAGRYVLLVEPYDPRDRSTMALKRFISPPIDIGASETRAVSLSPEK
ncbi:MAG: hypothetical protein KC777_05760 [Cyanobacteria bacterium HKST-UBA02]|nr:hypothetical protein [Cyanobacteria bacterium HKST-UBA02]